MAQHAWDQLYVYNPTDQPFQVKWAGNPYTLGAKQKIIWPRFLAEHFAKRLTDSILLARQEAHRVAYQKSGRPMSEYIPLSLLNSKQERPKVVESILTGVYQYHLQQQVNPNDMIQQQISQMNQGQPEPREDRSADMGMAVDPLLGVLNDDEESAAETDEQAQEENPPLPTAPESIIPANENPLQKRNRLIREAKQLGIKITPNMTNEQLTEEMKKAYA